MRHLAPKHARCMQRNSAQHQQGTTTTTMVTKMTMEHNVITHPGGERVEESASLLQRCSRNCLRPYSNFYSHCCSLRRLCLSSVLFCSVQFSCYCYFELVSYRKFNNFDILLHFYCVCDIIKRFYGSALTLFCA